MKSTFSGIEMYFRGIEMEVSKKSMKFLEILQSGWIYESLKFTIGPS